MFKGTTTIELTDVVTGKVDTYTDSNMVTNALTEEFRPLGLPKTQLSFTALLLPTTRIVRGIYL